MPYTGQRHNKRDHAGTGESHAIYAQELLRSGFQNRFQAAEGIEQPIYQSSGIFRPLCIGQDSRKDIRIVESIESVFSHKAFTHTEGVFPLVLLLFCGNKADLFISRIHGLFSFHFFAFSFNVIGTFLRV